MDQRGPDGLCVSALQPARPSKTPPGLRSAANDVGHGEAETDPGLVSKTGTVIGPLQVERQAHSHTSFGRDRYASRGAEFLLGATRSKGGARGSGEVEAGHHPGPHDTIAVSLNRYADRNQQSRCAQGADVLAHPAEAALKTHLYG